VCPEDGVQSCDFICYRSKASSRGPIETSESLHFETATDGPSTGRDPVKGICPLRITRSLCRSR
jgi:hypothetical protein